MREWLENRPHSKRLRKVFFGSRKGQVVSFHKKTTEPLYANVRKRAMTLALEGI